MKSPIVFFGNERIATGVTTKTPTLKSLVDNGYEIAAVVSSYEKGRSRSSRELEVEETAKKYGIPLLLPGKPVEILDQLKSYGAEIAVLAAYGRIVPQSVIDVFPKGIVNIHPSLLPLHRGPTPIESAILNGEMKTGVSLMRLAKAMDAGPVYAQSEIALDGTESKQELADKLLDIGAAMLIELLPGILDGSIASIPQDDERATYDSLISKDDGTIDWSKPAAQIVREIRAYMEWPKSRTELAGKDVVITKAYSVSANRTGNKPGDIEVIKDAATISVECGKGSLFIESLKPVGKKEMPVKAFLAGYGSMFK